AYERWSSNWASLTHTQDWLAVKAMTEQRMLSADAVFAPGHVARNDVPRWLTPGLSASPKLLGEAIFSEHYYLSPVQLESTRSVEDWEKRLVDLSEQASVGAAEDLMVGINK